MTLGCLAAFGSLLYFRLRGAGQHGLQRGYNCVPPRLLLPCRLLSRLRGEVESLCPCDSLLLTECWAGWWGRPGAVVVSPWLAYVGRGGWGEVDVCEFKPLWWVSM